MWRCDGDTFVIERKRSAFCSSYKGVRSGVSQWRRTEYDGVPGGEAAKLVRLLAGPERQFGQECPIRVATHRDDRNSSYGELD